MKRGKYDGEREKEYIKVTRAGEKRHIPWAERTVAPWQCRTGTIRPRGKVSAQ